MRLADLVPGTRFYLLLKTTGRRIPGTVIYVGFGSVTVQLDSQGSRKAEVLDKRTGEYKVIDIPIPARLEHWSLESDVEIEGE